MNWCRTDGVILLFNTADEARKVADAYNARTQSPNVSYLAAAYD